MARMIKEIIEELDLSKEDAIKIRRSLKGYKYVDEVSDLKIWDLFEVDIFKTRAA